MKFLIDECLTLDLVQLARGRGFGESSHVVWLGLQGCKDWELMRVVLDGDWTLVTHNAFDFRGPRAKPGSRGQYSGIDLHAGLICLGGDDSLSKSMQVSLFGQALEEVGNPGDLVNQVLEVWHETSTGQASVVRYRMPDAE